MAELIRAKTLEELIAEGAPQLFTREASAWKAKMVAWFEGETGRTLYPAQMEMLLIDMLAYQFSLLGEEAQMAVEQRWLAFAQGRHVEVLSVNNSTYQLNASAAVTMLRFTLAAALGDDLVISAGTRASVPSGPTFATDEALTIAAGETQGSVTATATVAGVSGNGFGVGTVTTLVDQVAAGLTVTNLTETEGGADIEDLERLRDRAAHAHDRISKAGGEESYRQAVLSYSPAIVDVAVIRPEPGYIDIYPLLETGAPDAAFMAGLTDWLSPLIKRPQGDVVTVKASEEIAGALTVAALAEGDWEEAKAALDAAIRTTAAAWQRRLGLYLAKKPFTCAAGSVANIVDIEVDFGTTPRQMAAHQFASLADLQIVPGEA